MSRADAMRRIDEQEEAAQIMMRDFGLSYNAAMIEVLDSYNRPRAGDEADNDLPEADAGNDPAAG